MRVPRNSLHGCTFRRKKGAVLKTIENRESLGEKMELRGGLSSGELQLNLYSAIHMSVWVTA